MNQNVAQAYFAQQGIPYPPLPAHLSELVLVQPALFASDAHAVEYSLLGILQGLSFSDFPPDCVVLGQMGHGINSWTVNLHLIAKPVLLFLAYPYENAYGERGEEVAHLAQMWDLVGDVLDIAPVVLAEDERLVVVQDLAGGAWMRFRLPLTASPWPMQESNTALADALAALREA